MKSTFIKGGILFVFAALSVCCVRPAEAPAASQSRSSDKTLSPNEVPAEPASDDELVQLLQEQNKRLKAQVQHLEKENADLKAKLPENQ